MTRAERWERARWELAGAAVLCLVLVGLEATVDPDGSLWSSILGTALVVLGVSLVYAVVVLALHRRADDRPTRR